MVPTTTRAAPGDRKPRFRSEGGWAAGKAPRHGSGTGLGLVPRDGAGRLVVGLRAGLGGAGRRQGALHQEAGGCGGR